MTDWLTLDVGGSLISTSRSTFLNCPGSVLARMFDPEVWTEEFNFCPRYDEGTVGPTIDQ